MNAIYENLKEKINLKARSGNVQESIIKSCYKFFFEDEHRWKENYNGKPIYIIGLSEDRYDYYWLCVDEDYNLKFITCCYKIDKPYNLSILNIDEPYKHPVKDINENDYKLIINKVKEYFKEHINENLIYLDENHN